MIFCIMGKSGTGKDTVASTLIANKSLHLTRLTPYTTRPMRDGEVEGREYHFVDYKTYKRACAKHQVVEAREYPHFVGGNVAYYTKDDTQDGKDYILITTPDAYLKICKYFAKKGIAVQGIYLELKQGTRLSRMVSREAHLTCNTFREIARRFRADETDYTEEKLTEYFAPVTGYSLPVKRIENEQFEKTILNCTNTITYVRSLVSSPAIIPFIEDYALD